MSYGFCAPCPDDGSEYVSRAEETRQFFTALRSRNAAQEEALAARAAAAGRSPEAQRAHEWAEAQAPLVAEAKAKALPVSSALVLSALNSRVLDMAVWISSAAIGATIAITNKAKGLFPSRSSDRPRFHSCRRIW